MVYDILLVLVVGAAYGYLKKGRQDKKQIFKTGAIWGLVIAVVLALIQFVTKTDLLGAGVGAGSTAVALFISFVIWVAVFVLGVFIGDWLEHR